MYINNKKDKKFMYDLKYRKKHVDKLKIKKHIYYVKNKNKISEKSKEYRLKNRTKLTLKHKEYYEKNKEKIREYKCKYRKMNVHKIKSKSRQYHYKKIEFIRNFKLLHPCLLCGEWDPVCLVFHHRRPEDKKYKISYSVHSLEKLKEEISKCDVLCQNCHMKIHYGQEEI